MYIISRKCYLVYYIQCDDVKLEFIDRMEHVEYIKLNI